MNGTHPAAEALAGAGESVLAKLNHLYSGQAAPGCSVGLKAIADDLGLQREVRKPRKKISVMIVGNHSAGKSSFINWYIGERVVKTGVAIETRGFILCTSGRKRETLTGDATIRYFDYLEGFDSFDGLLANLFTEISTSKERSFAAVDFVDTPGLVDGDMKYPFTVKESIMWMADHVDLILVFFDPIGQATCRRTLEVVEELNNTKHLEKIHYFMSKADEVTDERDRQRVLIQITQNLATRIRNSHAFNLPTFYLPHEDDGGLPCSIPNAIDDVCEEIDKAIHQTVQKTLKQLRTDCVLIDNTIQQRLEQDAANRDLNHSRTLNAVALVAGILVVVLLLGLALASQTAGAVCPYDGSSSGSDSGSSGAGVVCSTGVMQSLLAWHSAFEGAFTTIVGGLLLLLFVFGSGAGLAWRSAPVMDKRQLKRMEEYRTAVQRAKQQAEVLWEEYFDSIAEADDR